MKSKEFMAAGGAATEEKNRKIDALFFEIRHRVLAMLDEENPIATLNDLHQLVQSAISAGIIPLERMQWFQQQTPPLARLSPYSKKPADSVMLALMTERRADIAMSHVTERDCVLLSSPDMPCLVFEDDTTAIVRVPGLSDLEDTADTMKQWAAFGLSDEFLHIMHLAHEQNFTHVVLDVDGLQYDNLPEPQRN